jgi:hypothetical protein
MLISPPALLDISEVPAVILTIPPSALLGPGATSTAPAAFPEESPVTRLNTPDTPFESPDPMVTRPVELLDELDSHTDPLR